MVLAKRESEELRDALQLVVTRLQQATEQRDAALATAAAAAAQADGSDQGKFAL